ncbi:MAG: hypothetical protein HY905_05610 [Deltaproteobacteria bacterium]|nr:hypothetical protein [Deltaproteobacteria bacterium]
MNRSRILLALGMAFPLTAWLGCSAAGPGPSGPPPQDPATSAAPVEPGTPPASDEALGPPAMVLQDAPPICIALAVCGCFDAQRCVTARRYEDGSTVQIVDGEHAGETGYIQEACSPVQSEPMPCVDYVDPAMLCRALRPADDTAAKYLCSMDNIYPDYGCAFVDGVCRVVE